MFCPNCGKELSEGANFCSNCGKPVQTADLSGYNDTRHPADELLDRPIDQELADMLLRAQSIIHEAEKHNINYQNASTEYETQRATTGCLSNIGIGFLFLVEIYLVFGGLWLITGDVNPEGGPQMLLCAVVVAVILILIFRSRSNRIKHIYNEKQEVQNILEDNKLFLQFLPPEFRTVGRIDYIVNQFQAKRVKTLREAFDKCENAHIY